MKNSILTRRKATKRDVIAVLVYAIILGTLFFYSTHSSLVETIITSAIAGVLYFVVMLYLPIKQ